MSSNADSSPTILVLGIGNVVMADDGVGVKVIQQLQQGYQFPNIVKLFDGGTLGLDILPHLEGIRQLVVVDCVETGGAPGTLVRLVGEQIPLAMETKLSPHQMGLKDLLAVSHLMGHTPQDMVLIGVQPESLEMDTELRPAVQAQVEVMVAMVLDELDRWGVRPE